MTYYSPEYLEDRRREQARKRRAIVAAIVVLLCVAGVTLVLVNRKHHVVVVRVAAQAHNTPNPTTVTQPEYQAASGAPSLNSVRKALKKIHHRPTHVTHASKSTSGTPLTTAAEASFRQLAASTSGSLAIAVQPLGAGSRQVLGSDEPAHGWSTTKVPVLVSLMRVRGSEGLTPEEQTLAHSAITESNNESVLALFRDLERLKGGLEGASAYMESLLRDAGDNETTVPTAAPPPGAVTTFGQTEWSPGEAVRFFRALALGCLLTTEQTNYVLELMESIVPSESWGLGSAGFSSVAFKGGWGPESGGYLVRQSGIIDPGSNDGVAVAIVTKAPDFATGTQTLTRVAAWLKDHVNLTRRPTSGCSSE